MKWVIDDDVSNGHAYIRSKSNGTINIPLTGWEYIGYDQDYNGHNWHDDNTLRFTGLNIPFIIYALLIMILFI